MPANEEGGRIVFAAKISRRIMPRRLRDRNMSTRIIAGGEFFGGKVKFNEESENTHTFERYGSKIASHVCELVSMLVEAERSRRSPR